MLEPVSLWMLTAHLIADFPLQPNWMAEKKAFLDADDTQAVIDGAVTCVVHVAVHGVVFMPIAYFTLPERLWFPFIAWIMATHFIIDSRRWVEPNEEWDNPIIWVWLNDQLMHFVALGLAFPVMTVL